MKIFTTTLLILFFSTFQMTSYGQALDFQGTQNGFTMPSSGTDILGDFSIPHNFTIELKVKFPDPTFLADNKILSKQDNSYGFGIEVNNNNKLELQVSYQNQGYGVLKETSTADVVANTWYNLAVVYNANTGIFYFYIDGILVNNIGLNFFGTNGYLGLWNSPSNIDMAMNYASQNGSSWSKIVVSYVRFWNVAKTQAEIQSTQNTEVDCASANLLAQYKMNDGIAEGNNVGITTASDCTGNGHNANLTNFTMSGTTSNFVTEPALLPVELTAFEGFAQKNSIFLDWSTATEENNEGFYIERSEDGENWETLDFVAGNGTIFETQYYQYEDKAPYNGKNYYRLKQMDFDEQFDYSNIITIENTHQSTTVKLFPNPVVDRLMINSDSEIEAITIFNTIGQPILQQVTVNNQQMEINVSDLPKGVYTLQIKSSNSEIVVKQFVK